MLERLNIVFVYIYILYKNTVFFYYLLHNFIRTKFVFFENQYIINMLTVIILQFNYFNITIENIKFIVQEIQTFYKLVPVVFESKLRQEKIF